MSACAAARAAVRAMRAEAALDEQSKLATGVAAAARGRPRRRESRSKDDTVESERVHQRRGEHEVPEHGRPVDQRRETGVRRRHHHRRRAHAEHQPWAGTRRTRCMLASLRCCRQNDLLSGLGEDVAAAVAQAVPQQRHSIPARHCAQEDLEAALLRNAVAGPKPSRSTPRTDCTIVHRVQIVQRYLVLRHTHQPVAAPTITRYAYGGPRCSSPGNRRGRPPPSVNRTSEHHRFAQAWRRPGSRDSRVRNPEQQRQAGCVAAASTPPAPDAEVKDGDRDNIRALARDARDLAGLR